MTGRVRKYTFLLNNTNLPVTSHCTSHLSTPMLKLLHRSLHPLPQRLHRLQQLLPQRPLATSLNIAPQLLDPRRPKDETVALSKPRVMHQPPQRHLRRLDTMLFTRGHEHAHGNVDRLAVEYLGKHGVAALDPARAREGDEEVGVGGGRHFASQEAAGEWAV